MTAPVAWPERISGYRSGAINAIIDALDSLRPRPTSTTMVEWRSDGTGIHARGTGSGAQTFSGVCVAPNGVETTGLTDGAKPWVQFDETAWTFSEITGPPSVPWPAFSQYRRKSDIVGAWYAHINS